MQNDAEPSLAVYKLSGHAPPAAAATIQDADLREDPDGEDHHPRGREQRHHRQCQGQDPGQGRNPAGPAAADLRGQAAGRRPHPGRLQHPEGVHPPPRAPPPRRHHRALAPGPRSQVQPGEDDLPQVLCTPAPKGCQLPQEEMWPQQSAEAQEEDQELGLKPSLPL